MFWSCSWLAVEPQMVVREVVVVAVICNVLLQPWCCYLCLTSAAQALSGGQWAWVNWQVRRWSSRAAWFRLWGWTADHWAGLDVIFFISQASRGLGNTGNMRHGGSKGVGRVGLLGVLSHCSSGATVTFLLPKQFWGGRINMKAEVHWPHNQTEPTFSNEKEMSLQFLKHRTEGHILLLNWGFFNTETIICVTVMTEGL